MLADAEVAAASHRPAMVAGLGGIKTVSFLSGFESEGWVTSYEFIARGEMDVLSEAAEPVVGHPAKSLRSFLHEQAQANR